MLAVWPFPPPALPTQQLAAWPFPPALPVQVLPAWPFPLALPTQELPAVLALAALRVLELPAWSFPAALPTQVLAAVLALAALRVLELPAWPFLPELAFVLVPVSLLAPSHGFRLPVPPSCHPPPRLRLDQDQCLPMHRRKPPLPVDSPLRMLLWLGQWLWLQRQSL